MKDSFHGEIEVSMETIDRSEFPSGRGRLNRAEGQLSILEGALGHDSPGVLLKEERVRVRSDPKGKEIITKALVS